MNLRVLYHTSLMKLACSRMAESADAMVAKYALNATFIATLSEGINTTPWAIMHGGKKDVSIHNLREFGCNACICLIKDPRGNGKHLTCAVKAVNLGSQMTTTLPHTRFISLIEAS